MRNSKGLTGLHVRILARGRSQTLLRRDMLTVQWSMCILLIQTVGNTWDLHSPQMYLCVYPPPLISFTQPLPDNDGPHEDKHDNCPPSPRCADNVKRSRANRRLRWVRPRWFLRPSVVMHRVLWWSSWWRKARAFGKYSRWWCVCFYIVLLIFKRIIINAGALQAPHTFTKPWTCHTGLSLKEVKTRKKVRFFFFYVTIY